MSDLIYHNGSLYRPEDLSDDELSHYGVPGMKWGKRKSSSKSSAKKSFTRKTISEAANGIAKEAIAGKVIGLDSKTSITKSVKNHAARTAEKVGNKGIDKLYDKAGKKLDQKRYTRSDGSIKKGKKRTEATLAVVGVASAVALSNSPQARKALSNGFNAVYKTVETSRGVYDITSPRNAANGVNLAKSTIGATKQIARVSRSISR